MADEIDITAEREETLMRYAMQGRKPAGPQATGRCLWCEEQLVDDDTLAKINNGHDAPPGTRRWCDADCRDMHQRHGSK